MFLPMNVFFCKLLMCGVKFLLTLQHKMSFMYMVHTSDTSALYICICVFLYVEVCQLLSISRTPEPIIYNCTTGSTNPMTCNVLGVVILNHARESPTQHVQLYPNFNYTNRPAVHRFWELTTHFVPSLIADILLILQGKNPM